jgi:hypothetical protein
MAEVLRARDRVIATVALTIAITGSVMAQEHTAGGYAVGGIVSTRQSGPTGESPQTYDTAPGGATIGWLIGIGAFVTPVVSVEFEISSTGIMTAREPSRYGMTFNEERRDRFFSGVVRFHAPVGRIIDLEPVAGFSVARSESWSQTEYFRFWLLPQQQLVVEPRVANASVLRFGWVAGADLRIGGRHVAILPSFRWCRTGDGLSKQPHYPGGFPTSMMRAGAGLSIGF